MAIVTTAAGVPAAGKSSSRPPRAKQTRLRCFHIQVPLSLTAPQAPWGQLLLRAQGDQTRSKFWGLGQTLPTSVTRGHETAGGRKLQVTLSLPQLTHGLGPLA